MKAVSFAFAALAIGFASACGSFLSSADDVTPAPDAAIDAPAADTSPSEDAGIDADASPCTATTPTIVEDFASGGIAQWNFVNGGCENGGYLIEDRDAGDKAIAIHCSTKEAGTYSVLLTKDSFPLGAATHVAFAFEVSAADVHIFAQVLGLYGAPGANLSFVSTTTEIQAYDLKNSVLLASWPGPEQKEQWRTMTLAIEAKSPGSATYTVRGVLDGQARSFEITRTDVTHPIALQFGAFPNVSVGDFDNSFDDIRLWSCP